MGRQVEFYMLPEDEREFLRAIRAFGPVSIMRERSAKPEPETLESLPTELAEVRQGVVLWNPGTPGELQFKRLSEGSYIIDKANSEVLELRQCELSGRGLERGRIWADLASLSVRDGGRVPKSDAFVAWYAQVARWIRDHYARLPADKQTFVGPYAAEWARAGGRFA